MGRLPNVYISITDGGLGILSPNAAGVHAKVGVCSQGELNQIAAFSDRDQIAAVYGTGPLASSLADSFDNGARTIYAVRALADIEGTIGTVKASGASTLKVSGKPLDSYDVTVEITKSGKVNEAVFRYSLDGKDTYSGLITVPASGVYEIPGTGIQLTFNSTGTFAAGDWYSFTTKAPQASVSSVLDAVKLLSRSNVRFENIHIVGESSLPMWVAMDVMAAEMQAKYRYLSITMESRYRQDGETTDDWVAALLAERSQFSSTRCQVVCQYAEVLDTLTGRQMARNCGGIYRGYVSKLQVQQSPGEVALGALSGIVKLLPEDMNDAHILALDEGGFVTFRKYIGLSGIYVTNGRMMAEATSDYQHEECRRVMDEGCAQVYIAGLRFVKSGATEKSIKALQAYLQHPLDIMKGEGKVYSSRVVIPPDQDIWATSKLRVKIRIVPIPIMREIEVDIGLENPFLTATLAE